MRPQFSRWPDKMIDFLVPWMPIKGEPSSLTNEQAREAPPGHVLHGMPTEAVGCRQDCDDFLFALQDGTQRVAVVHLTWSTESDLKWPFTVVYASIDDWRQDCMVPDHQEWTDTEED